MTIESHLVISRAARMTITTETEYSVADVEGIASVSYLPESLDAPIASGSFRTHGMVIAPCSIKTLSAVANAYTADLLSRAADVTLKEGRPLILVVREAPLHVGHLRLMVRAAEIGAIIFPPMPAFYAKPQSLDDVVNNLVGRILARLGFENEGYSVWTGSE